MDEMDKKLEATLEYDRKIAKIEKKVDDRIYKLIKEQAPTLVRIDNIQQKIDKFLRNV